MDDEQRDEILRTELRTAHEAIERVKQMTQRTRQENLEAEIARSADHDPWRAAQKRRAAKSDQPDDEPPIRISEAVTTPPPATAPTIEPPVEGTALHELLSRLYADLRDEFNEKLDALRAEVRELRSIGVADFREQLNRTVAKCDELVDRLERREPRGEVLDLPSWSTRTGNAN